MDTPALVSGWQARSPLLLGLLRLIAAFLFIQYGTGKLLAFPGPLVPDGSTVEPLSLAGIASWMEIIGGALLFIGLFTRPVAFVLAGEMAFAYFIGHAPQGFWPVLNQGTPAVLFCFVFLYFSAAGPGAFSVSSLARGWRGRDAGFGAGQHAPIGHSR